MSQKILLIEDDVFLKDIYHEVLTSAGFSVVLATTLDEIMKEARNSVFDLVLIDFYLPGANGIEVVDRLKSLSPVPAKEFVFLTNVSDPNDLKLIEDSGCKNITKSDVSPQELVVKVQEILDGQNKVTSKDSAQSSPEN